MASAGGVLTDYTNASVRAGKNTLTGTIASKPALLLSDGIGLTYACDVQITQFNDTGRVDQYKYDLLGIPGYHGFHLGDEETIGTILRNCAISRNSYDLVYADIGTPVEITRTQNGIWVITGFAEEQAGTYTLVPVNLGDLSIGIGQDVSVVARILTLGELKDYGGGFGIIPFGAFGIFVGGVFQGVKV